MREDLDLKKYALDKGFTLDYSDVDKRRLANGHTVPYDSIIFTKGNISIWECGESYPVARTWWRKAELIDNRFCNHVSYDTLKEALDSTGETE